MAAITITPGINFEEDDFWIANGAISVNEQFVNRTAFIDNRGLLGLGSTSQTFSEFRFEANGLTYRYIGDWTLTTNGSLLSSTIGAVGSYSQVIVEQGGSLIASLVTDTPLGVNFGSSGGLAVAGLISLQPVIDLLFAADNDQSFVNLHLSVTPNLPDLAGIDPGVIIPGPGTVTGGTAGDDLIVGTPGNDTINGLEGNDTIAGLGGDDVIFGNQGNDSIDGGAGNDSLYGGQNDDFLSGGEGNDYLVGGFGRDVIFGNAGDEVIFGGNEAGDPLDDADTIYGGQGNDVIYGNGGNDVIFGGDGPGDLTDGNDTIYGGMGNDTINGNAGNDFILGQRGSDQVFGNEGNDFLHGGQENDTVNGGQGNDTIWGGLGDDVLTGGVGSDLFVFADGHGSDRVTDFEFADGDRLDLQGQTFTAASSGTATTLSLSGGGTIVLEGVTAGEFSSAYIV